MIGLLSRLSLDALVEDRVRTLKASSLATPSFSSLAMLVLFGVSGLTPEATLSPMLRTLLKEVELVLLHDTLLHWTQASLIPLASVSICCSIWFLSLLRIFCVGE